MQSLQATSSSASGSFGPDGRVPGWDYDETALDTGGGLRPSLTGQGLGRAVISAGLDFGRAPLRARGLPGHRGLVQPAGAGNWSRDSGSSASRPSSRQPGTAGRSRCWCAARPTDPVSVGEDAPADLVAAALVVEHQVTHRVGQALALPAALRTPGRLPPTGGRRCHGGLDGVRRCAQVVLGDVGDCTAAWPAAYAANRAGPRRSRAAPMA